MSPITCRSDKLGLASNFFSNLFNYVSGHYTYDKRFLLKTCNRYITWSLWVPNEDKVMYDVMDTRLDRGDMNIVNLDR